MKPQAYAFSALFAWMALSPEAALAEKTPSPLLESQVLEHVWSLRKDLHLPDLIPNASLDRIAQQVTEGTLKTRTQWEDYRGCTQEIIARVSRPCAEASGDPELYGRSVGEEIKTLIRKSPLHYPGLISKTKKPWNEFGYSIQTHQETIDGECHTQIVMNLVLGLDRPLRANEL